MKSLSQAGKEDLALALLFLKDFKCDGKFDIDVIKSVLELAEHLDVKEEFEEMMCKIPPMRIEPKYK